MNLQGLFLGPPVLKTTLMTKHMAGGDQVELRITFDIPLRRIVGQRLIKIDDASFAQLHYGVSKHRLAHGRCFKDSLSVDWFLRGLILDPKTLPPQQRSVVDNSDGEPWHVELLHQSWQLP